MNNLSVLFYLADLFDSITVLFLIAIVICFAGMAFNLWGESNEKAWFSNRTLAAMIVAFGLFIACMPSKTTMYLIAASEMGEKVLTSPEAVAMRAQILKELTKRDQSK
jgi:predicted PurR-regulated permease PerM